MLRCVTKRCGTNVVTPVPLGLPRIGVMVNSSCTWFGSVAVETILGNSRRTRCKIWSTRVQSRALWKRSVQSKNQGFFD
jgi:hypothetical protein